jgi:nucleoside transporter
MPDDVNERSNMIKLSIMMFLQFFVWGAWFATLGLCLGENGLSAIIGGAYGSQPIAAIIAPLFLGLIADRFFASERVLGVLHVVGGAILLLVPAKVAAHAGASPAEQAVIAADIVNLFNLHMLCYMPTIALSNSVAFSNISDRSKFPTVRVLGTIGWIAAGWVISVMNASDQPAIFTIAGISGIVLGIFSFFLPNTPPPAKDEPLNVGSLLMLDGFKLLLKPAFFVFVLCSTLICIPLSYYYAYTSVFMPEVGFDAGKVGFYMSFGQISEIVFMLLIPFFFRKLGTKWMLAIGMLAWVIRYALFAAGAPDSVRWMILSGVILHGICYDFFFVTGYMYTDKAAPPAVRNQAQSLVIFFTLGIGMFFGYGLAFPMHGKAFPPEPVAAIEAPAVPGEDAVADAVDAAVDAADDAADAAADAADDVADAVEDDAAQAGVEAPKEEEPPAPAPELGIIAKMQAELGKAAGALVSVTDKATAGMTANMTNGWQKFWAVPAIISAAVLVLFVLTFWYKDEDDDEEGGDAAAEGADEKPADDAAGSDDKAEGAVESADDSGSDEKAE